MTSPQTHPRHLTQAQWHKRRDRREAQRHEEALAAYEQARTPDPTNTSTSNSIGDQLSSLARSEEAGPPTSRRFSVHRRVLLWGRPTAPGTFAVP